MDNGMMIGASVISKRLEGFEGDLEAKVKFAMQRAWTDDTWYTGSADDKLRAAIGGVMIHVGKDSEEWLTLERSVTALRSLSALLSGVPVDFGALDTEGVLPLAAWFHEATPESARPRRPRATHTEEGGR